MELLLVVAVAVAGVLVVRRGLISPAAELTASVGPAPGVAFALDVEDWIEDPFGVTLEALAAGEAAEEIRRTWEAQVRHVLNLGLCDDVIRAGGDRAAVLRKVVEILGVAPRGKGDTGGTWGTTIAIRERMVYVALLLEAERETGVVVPTGEPEPTDVGWIWVG